MMPDFGSILTCQRHSKTWANIDMLKQRTFGAAHLFMWLIIVMMFSYVALLAAMWFNPPENVAKRWAIAGAGVGTGIFYFLYRHFEG